MTRSRRSPLARLFSAIFAIAFVLLLPTSALAQAVAAPAVVSSTADLTAADTAPAPAVTEPAAKPELPPAAKSAIESLAVKFPWLLTVLSIYGSAAVAWQLAVAFAHNWAARTADVQDDKWIAKLEAYLWFRVLDKIFYFGGYFGTWAGGKKL